MNRIFRCMAHKRKKKFNLTTPDQLRLLASPVAIEIVQAIRQKGPISIRDLGPILGRKPNSLHYHIRKLVKNGLVLQTGTSRSGARSEAIYDVVAEAIVGADLPKNKELLELTNAGVGSMLRLAKRNWDSASKNPEIIFEEKTISNLRAHRLSARLSKEDLVKVNEYILKIEDVFKKGIGKEDGQMCSVTVLLTPLEAYSEQQS